MDLLAGTKKDFKVRFFKDQWRDPSDTSRVVFLHIQAWVIKPELQVLFTDAQMQQLGGDSTWKSRWCHGWSTRAQHLAATFINSQRCVILRPYSSTFVLTHSCGGGIRSNVDMQHIFNRPVPAAPTAPAALGGERIPNDSVYLHPLTSVRGRASVSHDAHAHAKTIGLDGCFFKHQSAQLLQPGRPYGDHITASALPARLRR